MLVSGNNYIFHFIKLLQLSSMDYYYFMYLLVAVYITSSSVDHQQYGPLSCMALQLA